MHDLLIPELGMDDVPSRGQGQLRRRGGHLGDQMPAPLGVADAVWIDSRAGLLPALEWPHSKTGDSMAGEVLSQNEIDALLGVISGGDIEGMDGGGGDEDYGDDDIIP